MKKSPPDASAHTRLSTYPPAPARVELQARSAPRRALAALVPLVACWAAIPWLLTQPRLPLAALALCLGVYLAQRAWAGRYRVRSFLGVCPRCGRHLRIAAGTAIDLPHTLSCSGCGYAPRLEVELGPRVTRPGSRSSPPVRHLDGDCAGSWRERWHQDEPYLECGACGARHYATPEARALAAEENARGDLLERLADEGRFLD